MKDSFVAQSISIIKNLGIFQNNSVYSKTFYLDNFLLLTSTSLQNLSHLITTNRCRNRPTLNKKKLSLLTRDCNLPIFTANKAITNLMQFESSQEESDLLKAGLYFSIQPDKFKNPKSSLTLKRFINRFLTTLNLRKPNVR